MFSCPVSDLEAAGFIAWTVIQSPDERPSVAAGPIPTNRLRELAAVPGVRYVEGSRSYHRELNVSVPEVQADVLHSRNPARKGAGVVVGIIDSGIDIDHEASATTTAPHASAGSGIRRSSPSRARARRRRRASSGPPPAPLGVEYTQADINATLRNRESNIPFPSGTKAVRTADKDGHGTHVAGIAAGDGSQSGNCRGAGVYVGVAPAADILVVKRRSDNAEIGQSTNLLNALDWMWDHPVVLGATRPRSSPCRPSRSWST